MLAGTFGEVILRNINKDLNQPNYPAEEFPPDLTNKWTLKKHYSDDKTANMRCFVTRDSFYAQTVMLP